MKKQLLCLIAALVLLLGLCVSALAYDSAHVFDDAQLLSEDEIGALEARCQEAEDTFGCGVYIVTTCVPMAKPATVPLRTTARACSLNAIS